MVNRDVISVVECTYRGEEGRNGTNPVIRSGFLMIRNSVDGRAFLDAWGGSHESYANVHNPDQTSLEDIYSSPEWEGRIHVHDWADFHAYDTCDRSYGAFSLHFPGHGKVERVAKTFLHLSLLPKGVADWAKNEALQDHAGALLRNKLATYKSRSNKPPNTPDFEPSENQIRDIQECFAVARGANYTVDVSYSAGFHRYVHFYLLASHQTNIPNTIYTTLPNKERIPRSVASNLRSWIELNPQYQLVIHNDADMATVVRLLLPPIYQVWDRLLQVQKADIYRYAVTGLLGGFYADSDVKCIKPIKEWNFHHDDSYVVGIEAQNVQTGGGPRHEASRTVQLSQYVYAVAAFQPTMMSLLGSILASKDLILAAARANLTPAERLKNVLDTAGPIAFTDAFANYVCYAFGHMKYTPDSYYAGGHAPGAHVFDVSGFGAGQQHSLSPPMEGPGTLVYHKFGGSKALNGHTWAAKALIRS